MRQLWKKWEMAFFGILLAALFGVGCQKQTNESQRKAEAAPQEKVLSYSILSSIADLDPQKLNQMDASTIGYHIYEGLVRNEEGKIVPGGAQKWTVSKDGKKYVFTLRKSFWQNGKPVLAEDYVRGIQRLVAKETESDYGFLGYSIQNGAAVHHGALKKSKLGVKVLDEQRIEIRLEKKSDYFLQILSMVQFSPVPKEAFDQKKEKIGTSRETLFENGPFYVEEWNPDGLILRKNKNYWNAEEVKLDKVVITTKNSIKEARSAYQQGENNLFTTIALPAEEKESYSLYQDGQLAMVRLNLNNKKLADIHFRKALWYSIDQEQLNTEIYDKMYSPTSGFVMPELFGDTENKNGSYQPKKAAYHMEKAKKKFKWKKKKPWEMTLIYSESEFRKQVVLFLKEQWEKELKIKINTKAVSLDERFALEAQGKFDMILSKWVPDYDDPEAYLGNWHSNSPYNQGNFKEKAFDKKLKQAEKETGARRMEVLREAEEILIDKIPAIPLYFRRRVLMVKQEVKNLKVYYTGYQYNYIHCDVEQ